MSGVAALDREKDVEETFCDEASANRKNERTESESCEIGEDEETTIQDISLLQMQGIPAIDIMQLKSAGIKTMKALQMTMDKELTASGFKPEKIKMIKRACNNITPLMGFMTAAEICEERKQIFKLSTGSSVLDKLLGGGIEAMSITEVFGESSSGKTQLAHTLCITSQIPRANYSGGKVLYIDTEQTFRPERMKQIAERFCLDREKVMENVICARAYNSEHQFSLLDSVTNKLQEEPGMFKLLIIDSIMAHFRVDYIGSAEMGERQSKLSQMLSKLKKICTEYNIAVFITNQVTSDFSTLLANNETKPVGGNVLAHASTVRVRFKSLENGLRRAILLDSPDLEESEADFIITAGGIDDQLE